MNFLEGFKDMEMDLNKLGRLIEKCKDSGVSEIKISETGCEVKFSGDNEVEAVMGFSHAPQAQMSFESTGRDDSELNEVAGEEEDSMMHLIDPSKWQEQVFSGIEEREG